MQHTPSLNAAKPLYHGTSSVNLDCIKTLGLVPGHAKGGDAWAKEHRWTLADIAKTREPSVFLMDDAFEAEQFAHLAVREMGGEPIVITLHVPKDVSSTYVLDELFNQTASSPHHAYRAHSVAPDYIGEVSYVSPKVSAAEKIQTLASLLTALQEMRRVD